MTGAENCIWHGYYTELFDNFINTFFLQRISFVLIDFQFQRKHNHCSKYNINDLLNYIYLQSNKRAYRFKIIEYE